MLQPRFRAKKAAQPLLSGRMAVVGAAAGRAEPGAQASELIYKVNLQGVLLADRDQPGVLWAPHHPFAGLQLMEEIKGPTAGPLCSTVDRRPQRKAAVYSFI